MVTRTTVVPAANTKNGYDIDIKTLGCGDTYVVYSEDPTCTIGGLAGITFVDTNCNLFLRADGENNDWIIRCLCCYQPSEFIPPSPIEGFMIGAVQTHDNTILGRGPYLFPTMTNSPRGILSFWGNNPTLGTQVGNEFILRSPDFWAYIQLDLGSGTNALIWNFSNNDDVNSQYTVQYLYSDFPGYPDFSGWHHFLFSWDMDQAGLQIVQFYYDGIAIPPRPTWPKTFGIMPFTIHYGDPGFGGFDEWTIGNYDTMGLAEYYFAPGQYLDFSDSVNLLKYRSVDGKPISLGIDGSLPTGVVPILYLTISHDETDPAQFLSNASGAGSLTMSMQPLTIFTPSPTD